MDSNEEIKSPTKAIRAFCLECCGDSANEVKLCTAPRCPLYPFRFGKNPYRTCKMTEEQKRAVAERFAKAREAKKEKLNEN